MKNIKLEISNELKNHLLKMVDSKIAKLLLGEINPDFLVKDYANYLDFSKQDSLKISYVNPSRIEKISEKGLDIWTAYNYRYQSKPGAFLGKVFNEQVLNNKDVEKFNNLFKSFLVESEYNFEVVKGNKIRKWYDGNNYSECSGSLGNSCMKYEGCQSFFDIYIDNGVKMLILTNGDDLLVGRALLWKANDIVTGLDVQVMDRIYTTNDDELVPLFKNWAEKNGYIYRKNQNWNSSLHWVEGGQVVEKRFLIVLDHFKYDEYPYLDTFKFLNRSTGALTNYLPDGFENSSKNRVLINADGSWYDSNSLVLDEITHLYLNRDNCVFLENEGFYTSYENVNYSNILDRYILKTDSEYIEEISDFIFIDWDRNPDFVKEKVEKSKEIAQNSEEKIELKSLTLDNISGYLDTTIYFRDVINHYFVDYLNNNETIIEE
jgi:hypothetical protein